MSADTFEILKWISSPVLAVVVVWLTNFHTRRKEKAAREYAFRKEIFEPILTETVRAQQMFAQIVAGELAAERRMEQAVAYGAAISKVQLIATPATVRLVQKYAIQINRAILDVTFASHDAINLRAKIKVTPDGPMKQKLTADHAHAVLAGFDRLSPVMVSLIYDGVPVILALRKEMYIDTDDAAFELVLKQTADEGKAFFDHSIYLLKLSLGLTVEPSKGS